MCLLMQTSTPRERERRDRGRETERVFVNADKHTTRGKEGIAGGRQSVCLLMQTSTPRERERRDRGRETERVFVNADKHTTREGKKGSREGDRACVC